MGFSAQKKWTGIIVFLSLIGLASCGGGGGGGTTSSATPTSLQSTATVSNGTVTALGSVFVNGHEFDTSSANIVDADTGIINSASLNSTLVSSGLLSPIVGMTVAVNSATTSTLTVPVAKEVRITPLVRGYVDASDTTAGTITVMGQTIQITSSTSFTDKRACAVNSSCVPVTGQSNLQSTSGVTSGTYVIVYGYSYAQAGSTMAQIVATMVSAWDESNAVFTQTFTTDTGATTALYPFKVSGLVSINNNIYTIGNETINLASATCFINGVSGLCSSITNGSTISARGATAPSANAFTPAVITAFTGTNAINPGGSSLLVGQTVEIEGNVSSVSGTNFVVRGITIDGSQLTTGFPTVGAKVEFTGTVNATGSIVASAVQSELSSSLSRTIYTAPITVAAITSGAVAASNCAASLPAYTVTILGQPVIVDCNTEIADRTATVFSPFNITNFSSYLTSLATTTSSPTVYTVVSTYLDASSNRRATGISVIKAPATGNVSVSGLATMGTSAAGSTPIVVQGVTVDYGSGTTNITVNNVPTGSSAINVNVGDYVTAIGAIGTTNSNEVNTNISTGVLAVVQQGTMQSNASNHLGENSDHGGGNIGFRGFDN